MRRSLSAVWLIVFILFPLSGSAGERPIVAVFDMEDRTSTFDREVLENLTEYLSVKLAGGGYQVIPRDQVRERLVQEKKEAYRECFDQSCQIEMGRELAAQKVLSARILKVAGRCQLAATLYDLKKAATENAASAEGSCDEESMGRAVMKVSAKLSGKSESDFDDYLTAAKKKMDERRRADKAWKVIRAIAEDPKEPLESRIAGLKKFIDEFGRHNPHRDEARALIDKLSADLQELSRLGTLKVEAQPPDSRVHIEGKEVGAAPLDRKLQPGEYFVAVTADDHLPKGSRVEVSAGKATEIKIALEAAPPYSRWGHITFWSGLGAAAFGAISGILASSAGDDYKAGDRGAYDRSVALTGCMYSGLAAGGALMITGVVLWALAPDEDLPSGVTSFSALPSPEGGLVFSLGGRF